MDLRQLAQIMVVAVPFFVLAGAGWAWRKLRKRITLRKASAVLTDVVMDEDLGTLSGKIGGRTVRAALTSRGEGSSSKAWTEVRVERGGPSVDVSLWVQGVLDTIDVKRGLAVDVVVGDPAFDGRFVIEGAPATAVQEVFADAELRSALLAVRGIEATQPGSTVMVARPGWVWGNDLALMIKAAWLLTVRVCEVEEARVERDASVYRGAPELADRSGEAELAALERARWMRKKKAQSHTILLLTLLAIFVLFWCYAAFSPR